MEDKRDNNKDNILITGGAGFIGSHIVDELIKLNCRVTVLDDLSGGYRRNVNSKACFIHGSVNDVMLVNKLFRDSDFRYVFHLAAYAAEGLSHFIKRFNYENNLIGSVNLINASVNYGVSCFVFSSSIAVYGNQQVPMREEAEPLPEDSYGIAKYAVELELRRSQRMFGLNYIIFRPHNVYGERQNFADRYRNVIGIFINQLMKKEPMVIFGDGSQKRAFTYISDVAPVIARSIYESKAYNKVFNIGADRALTVNQLSKIVAKAMGEDLMVRHVPLRDEVKIAFADHNKIERIFGLKQTVPPAEGIQRMVDWARKIGPRKSKKFYRIEIKKNLPSIWTE